MNKLPFRIKPLAAAVAAASVGAMVSGQVGATDAEPEAGATQTATDGAATTFQAPFVLPGPAFTAGSGAFNPAFGLDFGFDITRSFDQGGGGVAATDLDGAELVACLYDANNNAVLDATVPYTDRRSGTADAAAGLGQAQATLITGIPADTGDFTQVTPVILNRGEGTATADGTASDDVDNTSGLNAEEYVFVVTDDGAGDSQQLGLTQVDVTTITGNAYQTAGGATPQNLDEICALGTVNTGGNRVAIDSTYGGPALQFAASDDETQAAATEVRLDFNAFLAAIGDTDVSAEVAAGAGTERTKAAVAAGATSFTIDDDGATFAPSTTVDITPGTLITDEALNPAVAASATTSSFEELSYAPSGMVAIAQASSQSADQLWNHNGATPGAGGAVQVDLRLDELVTVGAVAGDFTVAGAGTESVGAVNLATGRRLNITVNLDGAFNYCFDPATGELEASTDADCSTDSDDTAVTVDVADGTIDVTAASTSSPAFDDPRAIVAGNALTPTRIIETRDADADGAADGLLSGFEVDYGAAVDTLAGATTDLTGFNLKTNTAATGGAEVTLSGKFELDSSDSTRVLANVGVSGLAAEEEDWDGSGTGNVQADKDLFGDRALSNTGVVGTTLYGFSNEPGATSSAQFAVIWETFGTDDEDATDDGQKTVISDQLSNALSQASVDGAPPRAIAIDTTTLSPTEGAATDAITFVEEQGTDPVSGDLVVVASEGLVGTGATDATNAGAFNLDSVPLGLINVNAGLDLPSGFGLSTTEVANDTLTINDVSQDADGTTLTSISSDIGFDDGPDDNLLTTDGAQVVQTGTPVANNPAIVQAVATRAGGATEGNIDRVIVTFGVEGSSEGVKLPTTADSPIKESDRTTDLTISSNGAFEDGMFRVRAEVQTSGGATTVDIDIPGANVDDTNAETNGVIILTLPGDGIPGGQEVLDTVTVEYNNGADEDTPNRLVSATGLVSVVDDPGDFTGADDDDTAGAAIPNNSLALFTEEVKGTLTTDGTAAVEEGTIVRAQLLQFMQPSGSTTFDFGDGGRFQVQTEPEQDDMKPVITFGFSGGGSGAQAQALGSSIEEAREDDEPFVRMWLVVRTDRDGRHTALAYGDLDDALAAVDSAGIRDNDPDAAPPATGTTDVGDGATLHEIALNIETRDMVIVGVSGAVGKLAQFEETTSSNGLVVLDDELGLTDADGNFRLNVGTDLDQTDLPSSSDVFVLVSVKRPGEDWFQITPADPRLRGFTKFERDLRNAGTAGTNNVIRADLGTVDLSKFETISVLDVNNAAGTGGSAAGETDEGEDWQFLGFPTQPDFTATSVTGTDIDIERLFITIDTGTGDARTLWKDDGNEDDAAFTMRGNTFKMAIESSTGSTEDNVDDVQAGTGLALNNDAVETGTLFVPVTGDTPTRGMGQGWHLVTVVADVADPADLSDDIDVLMQVGNGGQARAWFRSESSGNGLTSLSAGDVVFAHFKNANFAFGFGQ